MVAESARILGVGAALPATTESARDLEKRLHLPPGWIVRRTGIMHRPLAQPSEATSDLAVRAGTAALQDAGIPVEKIGMLLLATSTPDHLLPPTAPVVAWRLGLRGCGAVDLAGACSGFLYALILAESYVRARGGYVLVIGANVLSRRLNPQDPKTSALFADGAGAVVVGPADGGRGIVSVWMFSDGSCWDALYIPAGGSRMPITVERVERGEHFMTMKNGRLLYRRAVEAMVCGASKVLQQAGVFPHQVTWFITHQANSRLIDEVRRQLGIPQERTVNIVARIANSSSATIPIALALHACHFKEGDLILLVSAGSGLLAGAVLLRW